eukprot:372266-Pyramimonas_sp.AAC.1
MQSSLGGDDAMLRGGRDVRKEPPSTTCEIPARLPNDVDSGSLEIPEDKADLLVTGLQQLVDAVALEDLLRGLQNIPVLPRPPR